MEAVEILRQADGITLEDEDGDVSKLQLLPPLSDTEMEALQSGLPCPLPAVAKALFSFARGFEGILKSVDFAGGLGGGFGMEEIFPHAIPIAHDGFGNYWIVDLTSESTTWGPIFFACHDAPVVVFQTDSLAHFISELIRFGNPPWESEINDVHEEHQARIWAENPDTLTYEQCRDSGDSDLVEFARSLGETFLYIDLRNPKVGDGFSWGRYGPQTINRQFGNKQIFAYEVRRSLFQRLFGRE
jgi:hypothetical protein